MLSFQAFKSLSQNKGIRCLPVGGFHQSFRQFWVGRVFIILPEVSLKTGSLLPAPISRAFAGFDHSFTIQGMSWIGGLFSGAIINVCSPQF